MRKRITLIADEGKVVTNGEIYSRNLTLAVGMSDEGFYEIPETEEPNKEEKKISESTVIN